jgi:hypothetical protein
MANVGAVICDAYISVVTFPPALVGLFRLSIPVVHFSNKKIKNNLRQNY